MTASEAGSGSKIASIPLADSRQGCSCDPEPVYPDFEARANPARPHHEDGHALASRPSLSHVFRIREGCDFLPSRAPPLFDKVSHILLKSSLLC